MIPNLEEARDLLKEYSKGDFHLLHGEVVSGIMGYFARQYDPDNEEYWAAVGMLHDIVFNCTPKNIVQNAANFSGRMILMNK